MEREERERGPDTGKIELQRILNFMKENKYHPTDSLDAGEYEGYYNLIFEKEIMYSDKEGTYINDRNIKVTIQFDTDFDYKTKYNKDRNGDFEYNDKNAEKAQNFIKKLMKDTYDSNSSKKGGQKNRKTKKK